MKKRLVAIFALAALLLCLLTACSSSVITADAAQKIALEDLGLSQKDVDDIHTHILTENNTPSYSIHITVGDMEYEYVISPTGEILSSVLLS